MDEGYRETDMMIASLERKLKKEYNAALKNAKKEFAEFLEQFRKDDEQWREEVKSGEKTRSQYKAWRRTQMITNARWNAMVKRLANDCTKTNQIAFKMINGEVPGAYILNFNYGTYDIEFRTKLDTAFTLYNMDAVKVLQEEGTLVLPEAKVNIPKDQRWNRQKINSVTTQAVLQGQTIDEIAGTMAVVFGMNLSSAIRNARTAIGSASTQGRYECYVRAYEMGIDLVKRWDAVLDMRTRSSHRALDGEIVSIYEKFSNGLRFPRDPYGDPSEVYNCRCELGNVIKGVEYGKRQRNDKLGSMTYEEWKRSKPRYERGRNVDNRQSGQQQGSDEGNTGRDRPRS